MSYILDALKKAEQERTIGQVPGIDSFQEPATGHAPRRWLWVLLIVLGLNATLLIVLLWPGGGGRTPEPAATSTAAPATESAAAPASAPARVPVPPVVQAASPQPAPATPAPVEPATQKTPVALRPLPPLPEPPALAMVKKPEVPRIEAAGSDENLPVWPQISGQLLGELNGSLHLDVHVYSDNPGERFVLINMRKYRTGQQLQEGPVVDDITPDSVILSFHGQRFRMLSQ